MMVATGLAICIANAESGEAAEPVVESAVEPGVESETRDEIIVSASHGPRKRSAVPSLTTVLDGEDLETGISTSVADALRFVPGLQLTQAGGRGGRAQLSLRGLDPNHVVVLIDGVRLNDPTNSRGGSFDPTTLALVDIERIEILRGPQSSIYGSDALAGVIHIVSRDVRPDAEPRTSLRARGGRFRQANVVAEASSGVADLVGLSIGAGYDTFRDPHSDSGYDGVSAKARVDARLPFDIELKAFGRIHESRTQAFPDSSGGSELATLRTLADRDVRETLFGVGLERRLGEIGGINLRASRMSRREDLDSPGIDPVPPFDPFADVPPSSSGDEYDRWDVALTTNWNLPSYEIASIRTDTRLIVGADVVIEDGESDTSLDFGGGPTRFPFFDERRTIGVFAEVEEQIGEFITASASARFDTTPDEDDRVSPAVGVAVDVPETPITLFGSYGEGFKRPSFYALGNPLVGNPNLRLEESRGWEVGIRGRSEEGELSGQLSYFDLEVKDIIDFDTTTFGLRNRSRLISRGVEVEVAWQPLEWLGGRGGATFNPTDFKNTSREPENRSRWRGYGEIVVTPTPTLEMTLRVLAVSSVKASSFDTGGRVVTLAGYERLDARIAWDAKEWLEIFLEIENLTDRTPREAVGFESPGIAPRVGFVFRH